MLKHYYLPFLLSINNTSIKHTLKFIIFKYLTFCKCKQNLSSMYNFPTK